MYVSLYEKNTEGSGMTPAPKNEKIAAAYLNCIPLDFHNLSKASRPANF